MSQLKEKLRVKLWFVLFLMCVGILVQNNASATTVNKPEHHTEAGFQNNPYVETAAPKGFLFYFRRFWHSVFIPDTPEGHALTEEQSLRLLNSIEGDRISWIGHATFLIKLSGITILTDPIITEFASPVTWAGPRRMVKLGFTLNNLPQVDVIVVSHNHYDHLDDETIVNLKNKESIHVVVPLGLKVFFTDRGYKNVTELDWHQSMTLGGINITSLPSVHDSGRSLNDQNKTLWSSWSLESAKNKVLFVGDSGYSRAIYNNIGNKYGAFDFAILPIGAYEPRELMWMSHVTPEEAVSAGTDVRAKTLIASHWGTVSSLSDEPIFEPPIRFKKAGKDDGYLDKDLWVMKIGESRAMSSAPMSGYSK